MMGSRQEAQGAVLRGLDRSACAARPSAPICGPVRRSDRHPPAPCPVLQLHGAAVGRSGTDDPHAAGRLQFGMVPPSVRGPCRTASGPNAGSAKRFTSTSPIAGSAVSIWPIASQIIRPSPRTGTAVSATATCCGTCSRRWWHAVSRRAWRAVSASPRMPASFRLTRTGRTRRRSQTGSRAASIPKRRPGLSGNTSKRLLMPPSVQRARWSRSSPRCSASCRARLRRTTPPRSSRPATPALAVRHEDRVGRAMHGDGETHRRALPGRHADRRQQVLAPGAGAQSSELIWRNSSVSPARRARGRKVSTP